MSNLPPNASITVRASCAACHAIRPFSDLLAFAAVRGPVVRRYVCRPTLARSDNVSPCFRAVVMGADVHVITLAEVLS